MLNIDNNSFVYLGTEEVGVFIAKQDGKECSKVDVSVGDYWIVKKGVPITIELVGDGSKGITIYTAGSDMRVPLAVAVIVTRQSPYTFVTYAEATKIEIS